MIELTKIKYKDKILKATRGKMTNYNGTPIKLPDDFSTETLQARRELHDMFKVMKDKNQEYSTQQDFPSDLMEKSKVFQTSKS